MRDTFLVFEHPPVVETVLGVQFAPLQGFTSAHAGWFWKRHLPEDWERATDAAPLADQFETFDEQAKWVIPAFKVTSGILAPRVLINHRQGDRLIQVQSSRFHYNWQKRENAYPHYPKVLEEFDRYFNEFRRFVQEARLGEIIPNQWELTYVDHIPKGELWQSPDEWSKVLPGLVSADQKAQGISLESLGSEWHYEITPKQGRLHVALQQAIAGERGDPVLMLQMTARGPLGKESKLDLKAGLDLGHEVIIRSFFAITSARAHTVWGLRKP